MLIDISRRRLPRFDLSYLRLSTKRFGEHVAGHGIAGSQATNNLDFEDWPQESHEIAEADVYTFDIRSAIQSHNDQEREIIEIGLGQAYIDQMKAFRWF